MNSVSRGTLLPVNTNLGLLRGWVVPKIDHHTLLRFFKMIFKLQCINYHFGKKNIHSC